MIEKNWAEKRDEQPATDEMSAAGNGSRPCKKPTDAISAALGRKTHHKGELGKKSGMITLKQQEGPRSTTKT